MTVCEGLLCDESIAAVVLKGVAQCGGFGCALSGMEVTRCLDDLSKLPVGVGKADVRLLYMQSCEFGTQVGFGYTEI